MFNRLQRSIKRYPLQLWLMFAGFMICSTGIGMVWPFLAIFLRQRLTISLTGAASLMMVYSIFNLLASILAGSIIDILGRKRAMIFSLLLHGAAYLLMTQANTILACGVLLAVSGAASPFYRTGLEAMVADLVSPELRSEGYSLERLSENIGVAVGPMIGGFLAVYSYSISFFAAAICLIAFSLIVIFLARETLSTITPPSETFTGYAHLLNNRLFLWMTGLYTLCIICEVMTFLLLPIYGKDNFGISESQYGFIMASNAITVILLQMPVTLFVRRFKPLNILAFGAGFFAMGFVGMIFSNSFWTFMASMVVLSMGEITLVPTATTLAANSAPEDMRGRYMSIFGLAWGLADGVGPMFGGFLSDAIAPVATWYGGLVVTFLCLVGFVFLSRRYKGLRLDSPSLPIHLLKQQ